MILRPINNPEEFYKKSEEALGVFGSKKWLSIYGNELELIGIYKDESQLIGGFYYLKTKRYGFNFIKLPPYTPHCGLFFSSENSNKSSRNTVSKEVMSAVCEYLMQQKSTLLILAFPSQLNDMQPFIWNKFKVVPNYTYRLDLAQSIEDIKNHFDSKHRNAINKAIKEQVIVEENTMSKKDLFHFFSNSLEQAKANLYTKELKAIFYDFSDENSAFSLTAKKEDVVMGCVYCIYDKHTCYYLLGGINKTEKIQGVNNLLILYAIEKAKNLGCKTFDFEGSMLKGVEKFFRGFGPELVPYFTVNKGKLALELLLKFKKRELF